MPTDRAERGCTLDGLDWSTDDVERHLRSSAVFGHIDDAALRRVAEAASIALLRAGETLVEEGDPGTDAFIVIAGRLEIETATASGGSRVVNHLGPGDVVGEMALLTEEPRSASVRARRDSALMRVASDDFRRIVIDHPGALLDVTKTVMARLNRAIHDQRPERMRSVIAILPAGGRPAHYEFAGSFAAELGSGRVTTVTAETVRTELGEDANPGQIAQHLHHIEDRNDFVVLIGEAGNPAWSRLCRRQSDLTLRVGYADALRAVGDYEDDLEPDDLDGSPSELVLVHDATSPQGTAEILAARSTERHHHVRNRSSEDVARVARIVRGESTGVVFGGGGARGFAHLGVLKAMIELGIPIDHVGGSSIGASVAAGVALGLDWDEMVTAAKGVTFENGSIVDSTLPAVAVARGRRLVDGIRDGYGEADIRDLWMDFYCVSADLTDGTIYEHRSGPVWKAVRSSVAIPGLFPPMRSDDGHVLVDGGVLDNVPTSSMHSLYAPNSVIAVDLRAPSTIPSDDLTNDGAISGWRVARHRWLPWEERLATPGIIETLIAASTVSGSAHHNDADLVIRPPVEDFGFMDFAASDQIIEAGYRHGLEVLDGWQKPR